MNTEDRVMWGIISVTILLFGGIIIALLLAPFMGVRMNPGSGEKIGQIVRMSHEGIVCKTWEAQLIRGGMNQGSGSFGVQPFEFTVPESLVNDVQNFMKNQVEVTIRYTISGVYATCNSGSGGHYLLSIGPLTGEMK